MPEPWRSHVDASLVLIDDLEARIAQIAKELRRSGADHRYIPTLMTAPGFGWITSFTVACEIGDISRFCSPVKLTGYTGLCPRVKQSGQMDQRGPLSKHGPRYLRWGRWRPRSPPPRIRSTGSATSAPGVVSAASADPSRADRPRPPAHRGDLVHAPRNQPFAPAGPTFRLAA